MALVMFLAFGVLAAGVIFSVLREDQLLDPVSVPTPRSSDVAEWACPSGTVGQVTCGYVDVPADYADPDIEKVRVFIATVAVPLEQTGPPLVFLGTQLGPGSVADFAAWRQIGRELGREIILVDHRGTGLSDPQVNCLDLTKVNWLETDLGNAETLATGREERRQALIRCTARLGELPANPIFDFETVVRDLTEVRQSLGIEQWLIVGSGETVPLAVALEQADPDAAEALVLLRAAPADGDGFERRNRYAAEALAAALGCDSTSCVGPTLAPIQQVSGELGQRSLVFSTAVGDARQPVSVSGATVLPSLALSVVEEPNREALPAVVESLGSGRWRQLATLRGQRFRTHDNRSLAVHLAIGCSIPTTPVQAPAAVDDGGQEPTVDPWLALLDDPLIDPELCRPSQATAASTSAIPQSEVLIVNQAFDYLAPGSAAQELQARWPGADIEIVRQGGPPSLADPCVLAKVGQFLGLTTTIEAACQ